MLVWDGGNLLIRAKSGKLAPIPAHQDELPPHPARPACHQAAEIPLPHVMI